MIEKLDNNEQILLMYLAGELSAADQADVDRLLAADGGLRRSLAELQGAQAFVHDALAKLDEAQPLPVSVEAAARQAARAMRQHLARPRPATAERAAEPSGRPWWWLYPTVTAASVLIIAMLCLNHLTGPTRLPPQDLPGINSPGPGDAVATNGNKPAQAIALNQKGRDADDALLLDSLQSPMTLDEQRPSAADDDSKRVALNDLTAVPQDEVSRLLLNANGVEQ